MSPPDSPRTRSLTRPPVPPPGPPGFEARLINLENAHGTLERDLGDLTAEMRKLTDAITGVQNTLLVASTEKKTQDARRETFMKWVVGVAIGISVMALGTLAAWVIHLQTALSAVHQ